MSAQDGDSATDGVTSGERRNFLRRGLLLAAAGAASPARSDPRTGLEPWRLRPGTGFSIYGAPAAAESRVVRWISSNPAAQGNGASWSPLHLLEGSLTPAGLHFERHHNGVPAIEPAQHRLRIFGRVERPLEFSIAALMRYPRVSRHAFIECGGNSNAGWHKVPAQAAAGHIHGLVSCSEWSGVPLRYLLAEVAPRGDARWVIAGGADAFSLTMSIPLDKALDDCLLALYQNGERLRPEQGYPVRLLAPGWEGVVNVKWLTSLEISDQPAMARNETSKYTELQPDGNARMFTFTMEPKSVITAPSGGMQLTGPGWYEITGLAWSGHAAVKLVEVSVDGGNTWIPAHLDPPVIAKSWTRFRLGWQWAGDSAILQSRVTDESGRVQPARAALVAARGSAGYYHYNAIVSWAVAVDGTISHVYTDAIASTNELDSLFLDDKWN